MVLDKIREIVAEQFMVDADKVRAETAFARKPGETAPTDEDYIHYLDADSLDIAVLTAALEDEFGLPETPEEALMSVNCVGDLADYVIKTVGE